MNQASVARSNSLNICLMKLGKDSSGRYSHTSPILYSMLSTKLQTDKASNLVHAYDGQLIGTICVGTSPAGDVPAYLISLSSSSVKLCLMGRGL